MLEHKHKTVALALAAGLAVSYAGAAAPRAMAAATSWQVGSGDWSTASNWNNGEPVSGVVASINNGGTATITQTGEATQRAFMGKANGDTGTLEMTAGSLTTDSSVTVGNKGTGTFNMSGGTVHSGNDFEVGNSSGGQGTFNLSGGTVNVDNVYQVGPGGTGHATQTDGDVTAGANGRPGLIVVGGGSSGNGSYDLSGGSLTTTNNRILIGNNTTGTLNQTGGTISSPVSNSNGDYILGNNGSADGSVDQSAGTTTMNRLFVGHQGSGDYTISGGMLTLRGDMSVGGATDANGDAVSGNSGLFTVNGATGQINVGGDFHADGDDATLAFNVDASGVSIINVVGDATIASSTVNMGLLNSFTPSGGQTYDLLTAATTDGVPNLASEDTANWSLALVGGGNGQLLQATYVPEPASLALLGLGGLALLGRRRRHA